MNRKTTLMLVTAAWLCALAATTAAHMTRAEREAAAAPAKQEAMETLELEQRLARGLDAPVDPDTYIIGPNDLFLIVVHSAEDVELPVRVLPEGTVLLPNVGAIHVAGMTITEFRAKVRELLVRYYRDVNFDCQLVVPRSFVVYVLGEVERPGAVELHAPFRLDAAIESAGGLTDRASRRAIEIRSAGGDVQLADAMRFERLGDVDANPVLREGQSVFVPARGQSAVITGEVWRGGVFEIRPGETVATLIGLAAGFTANADCERIVVERLDSGDHVSIRALAQGDLDTFVLQDRDVVVVPDRRSFPRMEMIRIDGGGGREGAIYVQEGETIGSLLPRFVRLSDNYVLERAVVERRVGPEATDYIPVDLKQIVNGSEPDTLRLYPGDVVSVPQRVDGVYVTGNVVIPGEVAFQHGRPAGWYVALAGGPSEGGSHDRLEIHATDGSKRSASRNSVVYRGEAIYVKSSRSRIFGSVFVGVITLTSLILSMIAVSK
jgi:protein involved in polysaccharide export with SLBB domain